jgi:uroporphyrinogen decarboxylase
MLESERYHDHFLVVGIGFGLFERTWTIRGFENALSDVALHPDFFDVLVEKLYLQQTLMIERLLALPVDGIFLSDDWGYQDGVIIGAKRWRKFFKPRLAKMSKLIRRQGVLTIVVGASKNASWLD